MKNVGIAVGGGQAFAVPGLVLLIVGALVICGAFWVKSELFQH